MIKYIKESNKNPFTKELFNNRNLKPNELSFIIKLLSQKDECHFFNLKEFFYIMNISNSQYLNLMKSLKNKGYIKLVDKYLFNTYMVCLSKIVEDTKKQIEESDKYISEELWVINCYEGDLVLRAKKKKFL